MELPRPRIAGISAFYHDAACCLLAGGRLIAAAQEERFSRLKHDPRLPVEAFRFCLAAGGLGISDLDAVAYYESPVAKLSRQIWSGVAEEAAGVLGGLDPRLPELAIRERLGWDGPLLLFDHHRSHAASAFYFSGFEEAAILTVDGVGEWATTTYGRGSGAAIERFAEVAFPHSLGLLYSTLTSFLGFRVNDGESKVMGLAPYGRPCLADRLGSLVASGPGGAYTLDLAYFDFVSGRRMDSDALAELLGGPRRTPGEAITPFHCDVAASLQAVLETVLLEKVRWLHGRAGAADLAMAGGVALNCVANGRIRREGPFARLFVQPAAGDAGGCLGAAALAHRELTGERPARPALADVRLGPRFAAGEVAALLAATGLPAADFRGREPELVAAVAERLARGEVVAWFRGAMEMGPRALGARSLLADPRHPGMRERLNRLVKRREGFRPFAPSVLAERAGEHFDLDHASPFMLETCRVVSPLALPAVTHVDGSARPQTVSAEVDPRFAALLAAFERRTGCPLLLNTSLNLAGEPIVCTPAEALSLLGRAPIDALALEDFVIERRALPASWPALLAAWETAPPDPFARRVSALDESLYSFV